MKITDFVQDGQVDAQRLERSAIKLSLQARVSEEDLAGIRKSLGANELAVRCIGRFLRFANTCLKSAEQSLIAAGSPKNAFGSAYAEVDYGGQTFLFPRG